MKFPAPLTARWIADFCDAEILGEDIALVLGLNEIHKVETGDLTFVDHPKYYRKALDSAASFILINTDKEKLPAGKTIFVCSDPLGAYNKLSRHFSSFTPQNDFIHPTATIGKDSVIQPGVFIGAQVKIGARCLIHANVSVYDHTEIGEDVVIHSGTVIGADAFYFQKRKTGFVKLHSCGRVLIHDKVEIGACCTIDRGVSGDTIIGEDTKLDNHVHIGHGVVIGKQNLFAAQVGVGGKTIIGDDCIFWGQVGISKDLTIGNNTIILAQSGVGKNLPAGKSWFGTPVQEARDKMKEMAWVKQQAKTR